MNADTTGHVGGTRYATVVIRLALDSSGALRHGELLDAEGGSIGRYAQTESLLDALRGWIARQRSEGQG